MLSSEGSAGSLSSPETIHFDLISFLRQLPVDRITKLLHRVASAAYFSYRGSNSPTSEIYIVPDYDDQVLRQLQEFCDERGSQTLEPVDLLVLGLLRCQIDCYISHSSIDAYLSWRASGSAKGHLDHLLLNFSERKSAYAPTREVLTQAWRSVETERWSVAEFIATAKLMIKHYYRFPAELLAQKTFMSLVDPDSFMQLVRAFRDIDMDQSTQERLAGLAVCHWKIDIDRLIQEKIIVGDVTLCYVMWNRHLDPRRIRELTASILGQIRLRNKQNNVKGLPVLSEDTWDAILGRGDYNLCKWLLQSHQQMPRADRHELVIKKIKEKRYASGDLLLRLYSI